MNWDGPLAIVLLLITALGAWMAIDYLWERIDAPTRVALMLGSGIAVYGFGWCMDRFAGRSGKGKAEAPRGRDHGKRS